MVRWFQAQSFSLCSLGCREKVRGKQQMRGRECGRRRQPASHAAPPEIVVRNVLSNFMPSCFFHLTVCSLSFLSFFLLFHPFGNDSFPREQFCWTLYRQRVRSCGLIRWEIGLGITITTSLAITPWSNITNTGLNHLRPQVP